MLQTEKRKASHERMRRYRKCKKCESMFSPSISKCQNHCVECKPIPREWDDLRRDSSRKGRLLKERGHKCEICGLTEWMGQPAPIELDHIDGNSDNNQKTNLRLLCANCHSLTPTHAGKNAGRHQTERAKIMLKYRGKYR